MTLSAVSRVSHYGAVCVAVPLLRRRPPGAAAFRLPGGLTLPLIGFLICALLLTRVDFSKSIILVVTIGLVLLNWVVVRERPGPSTLIAPKA